MGKDVQLIKELISRIIEPAGKENASKSLIQKPIKTQMVAHWEDKGYEENLGVMGRDLDEETSAQNFLNVAKQADLSPRLIDKGRSTCRGKKKQPKETPSTIPARVQTRRTVSKSHN